MSIRRVDFGERQQAGADPAHIQRAVSPPIPPRPRPPLTSVTRMRRH
jgi:hypothetical protein